MDKLDIAVMIFGIIWLGVIIRLVSTGHILIG